MNAKQFSALTALLTSLFATPAFPDADGLVAWNTRMQRACSDHFAEKLASWPGIAPTNRMRLAIALCKDDRVFWPYALENQRQLAPLLEERLRRSDAPAGKPLTLGIIGPSARENSEALHAIRDLFFLPSNSLYRWGTDRSGLNEWLKRDTGGLFGGVVFVEFSGLNHSEIEFKTDRALEALEYMQKNQMTSYVLALSSQMDVRGHFADVDMQWIDFGVPENARCSGALRSH